MCETNGKTVVGVDIGTTFSKYAVFEGGSRSEIVETLDGRRAERTAVSACDERNLCAGARAWGDYKCEPGKVVVMPKLYVSGQPGFHENVVLRVDGVEVTVQQVFQTLARHVKELLDQRFGAGAYEVCLSHPAQWGVIEKDFIKQVFESEEVAVRAMISEPEAAVYAAQLQNQLENGVVAVFDLGGGTFDVAIVKIAPDKVEVLACTGVAVAGAAIDEAVYEYVTRNLLQTGQIPETMTKDSIFRAMLLREAEEIKITLDEQDSARLVMMYDGSALRDQIDIGRFSRLVKPSVDAVLSTAEQAMAKAGVGWSKLSRIVLAGPGWKGRPFQEALREKCGNTPIVWNKLMEHGVAAGAALHCARRRQDNRQPLTDSKGRPVFYPVASLERKLALPLSLIVLTPGTSRAPENCYAYLMLPDGIPLPAEKTNTFNTVEPFQPAVDLRVVEEPHGTPELKCGRPVLRFEFPIKPDARMDNRLSVTFRFDVDGILHLEAKDLLTGAEQSFQGRLVDVIA